MMAGIPLQTSEQWLPWTPCTQLQVGQAGGQHHVHNTPWQHPPTSLMSAPSLILAKGAEAVPRQQLQRRNLDSIPPLCCIPTHYPTSCRLSAAPTLNSTRAPPTFFSNPFHTSLLTPSPLHQQAGGDPASLGAAAPHEPRPAPGPTGGQRACAHPHHRPCGCRGAGSCPPLQADRAAGSRHSQH